MFVEIHKNILKLFEFLFYVFGKKSAKWDGVYDTWF
jgi:hypothetical protein